jgi:hypothetical protein
MPNHKGGSGKGGKSDGKGSGRKSAPKGPAKKLTPQAQDGYKNSLKKLAADKTKGQEKKKAAPQVAKAKSDAPPDRAAHAIAVEIERLIATKPKWTGSIQLEIMKGVDSGPDYLQLKSLTTTMTTSSPTTTKTTKVQINLTGGTYSLFASDQETSSLLLPIYELLVGDHWGEKKKAASAPTIPQRSTVPFEWRDDSPYRKGVEVIIAGTHLERRGITVFAAEGGYTVRLENHPTTNVTPEEFRTVVRDQSDHETVGGERVFLARATGVELQTYPLHAIGQWPWDPTRDKTLAAVVGGDFRKVFYLRQPDGVAALPVPSPDGAVPGELDVTAGTYDGQLVYIEGIGPSGTTQVTQDNLLGMLKIMIERIVGGPAIYHNGQIIATLPGQGITTGNLSRHVSVPVAQDWERCWGLDIDHDDVAFGDIPARFQDPPAGIHITVELFPGNLATTTGDDNRRIFPYGNANQNGAGNTTFGGAFGAVVLAKFQERVSATTTSQDDMRQILDNALQDDWNDWRDSFLQQ